MLDKLLEELLNIQKEVEELDANQLSDNQKISRVNGIADKIINILDNAKIKIPEEYQDDGGEQA